MGKRQVNAKRTFDPTVGKERVASKRTSKRIGEDTSQHYVGPARSFEICNVPIEFDEITRYTSESPLGLLKGKTIATWRSRTKVELKFWKGYFNLFMNGIFIAKLERRDGASYRPYKGIPQYDVDEHGVKIKGCGNIMFSLYVTTQTATRTPIRRTLEMTIVEIPQKLWVEEDDEEDM